MWYSTKSNISFYLPMHEYVPWSCARNWNKENPNFDLTLRVGRIQILLILTNSWIRKILNRFNLERFILYENVFMLATVIHACTHPLFCTTYKNIHTPIAIFIYIYIQYIHRPVFFHDLSRGQFWIIRLCSKNLQKVFGDKNFSTLFIALTANFLIQLMSLYILIQLNWCYYTIILIQLNDCHHTI